MVGRKEEIGILKQLLTSKKAELLSITGRRRIGKTYLVRSVYAEEMVFELEGVQNKSKASQLQNFAFRLQLAKGETNELAIPKDWMTAFHRLIMYLESVLDPAKKSVVFIDELPWLATHKSDFLTGFGYFWNSYASKKNLVVVICGSATSWIIRRVINDKGGLHNRVTKSITLSPFTLAETEAFIHYNDLNFTRYQIANIYMVMGGVAHYLNQLQAGLSAVQNINEICFAKNGFLRHEFENLFSSLFKSPEDYQEIITTLSQKWLGMTRKELLDKGGFRNGGSITRKLEELELSGFIMPYYPLNNRKRDTVYRLTDNYCLFYLKFIRDTRPVGQDHWLTISQTQSWKSWSGYAFENICLQHTPQIKQALRISGVSVGQYSYLVKGTDSEEGVQIDLLLDRADNVISVCEVKFYNDEVELTKEYAAKLRRKLSIFAKRANTKKQVQLVLISPYGLHANKRSLGFVDASIDLDDLFKSINS